MDFKASFFLIAGISLLLLASQRRLNEFNVPSLRGSVLVGLSSAQATGKYREELVVVSQSGDLASVARSAKDRISISPLFSFGLPAVATLVRAPLINLTDGLVQSVVPTFAVTVNELLAEHDLELGEFDRVTPSRETVLTPEIQVTVTRVTETTVRIEEVIPFTTETTDDSELLRGETKVVAEGKLGKKVLTFVARRENGKEVSRKKLKEEVVSEPKTKLIVRGIKVISIAEGTATWYGRVPERTAAHRTLPKGKRVQVENLANGKTVVVKINDRGPFTSAIIDLSKDSFAEIANLRTGVIKVRLMNVD